jgi:hypothetical protein
LKAGLPGAAVVEAISYGLGGAIAHFHQKKHEAGSTPGALAPALTANTAAKTGKQQKAPPTISGIAAAYTDKGTCGSALMSRRALKNTSSTSRSDRRGDHERTQSILRRSDPSANGDSSRRFSPRATRSSHTSHYAVSDETLQLLAELPRLSVQ